MATPQPQSLPTASLRNLTTGETLFFQFHPTTLEENIQVSWGRALPLFGTSEVTHYNGTRSERIKLSLLYTEVGVTRTGTAAQRFTRPSSTSTDGILESILGNDGFLGGNESNVYRNRTIQSVVEAERFLKALCYPKGLPPLSGKKTREFRGDPPPLVLFNWPNALSLEGYVDRVAIKFERFDVNTLAPITLRANIDFVEETNQRIDGDSVRRRGSFRAREVAVPQRQAPPVREVRIPQAPAQSSFR